MTLLVGPVHEIGIESSRVAAFYGENWERRIALIDQRFYDWQFKSAPTSVGLDQCMIAYDSDRGMIAGVMGLNERPFNLAGIPTGGAELTTWVVAEEYRSAGAGAKILSRIQAKYDVLIGMGISPMAVPVYLRSGFRYLAAIPRFVRVYNYDAVSRVSKADPLAGKLARQWLNTRSEPYNVAEYSGAEAESLFDRLATSYNLFSRDSRHLSWRYAAHPTFNYRIFLVRPKGGASVAFVALRIESAIPGLTICHVLDCVGDDAAMDAAFSCIDDICRSENIDVADFYCTSGRVNKYPLSCGWFSTLDDKCLTFPHLFHPLEIRTPATTSLIYWAKRNLSEMCDFSNLYITKQDADLDRPTLEGG
jgi:hypothetical protein